MEGTTSSPISSPISNPVLSFIFDRIVKRVSSLPSERRLEETITAFQEAGLNTRSGEDLVAISYDRTNSPPQPQWRDFANTIICPFPSPHIVAWGPPEMYYPSTQKLSELMSGTSGSGGSESYRISTVIYGTVFWVYYRNGRWRLGTKRSPDAEKETIRGIRLADVVDSLIDRDSLPSKDLTYGFLLHHRPFHLLQYASCTTRAWLLSARDAGGKNLESVKVIGRDGVEIDRKPDVAWDLSLFLNLCDASSHTISASASASASISRAGEGGEDDGATFLGIVLRRIGQSGFNDWIIKSPLYAFIDRKLGDGAPIAKSIAKTFGEPPHEVRRLITLFPSLSPLLAVRDRCAEELVQAMARYRFSTYATPAEMRIGRLMAMVEKDSPRDRIRGGGLVEEQTIRSIILRPDFSGRALLLELISNLMIVPRS